MGLRSVERRTINSYNSTRLPGVGTKTSTHRRKIAVSTLATYFLLKHLHVWLTIFFMYLLETLSQSCGSRSPWKATACTIKACTVKWSLEKTIAKTITQGLHLKFFLGYIALEPFPVTTRCLRAPLRSLPQLHPVCSRLKTWNCLVIFRNTKSREICGNNCPILKTLSAVKLKWCKRCVNLRTIFLCRSTKLATHRWEDLHTANFLPSLLRPWTISLLSRTGKTTDSAYLSCL